jgi:serine/threonine protein kinase
LDPAAAALAAVVARDGKLRLRHFSRVKQLGSGDVGMVDLVQLVGTGQRFALKSLEKREMLERNKVRAWACISTSSSSSIVQLPGNCSV